MLLGSRGATNVTPNSRPSDAAVHRRGSQTQENATILAPTGALEAVSLLTLESGLILSQQGPPPPKKRGGGGEKKYVNPPFSDQFRHSGFRTFFNTKINIIHNTNYPFQTFV